ncbi:hypothetical protein INT45_005241 [Circinella minor]|uniref:BHLH domain-containing protein n=1 Tax=Circinella minor TaxID=1195481 RepID=A0A8H7VFU8_9FUNG|nr:hypothetical protein INT45_005241 [Circinella minor]
MGQDLAEEKPINNSDSAKEPTGKAATAIVEIQSNKSSQEPTATTQQSPRPSYLTTPSDNNNTRATTHPQTQIWQNSTIASQPSPKPYQFNNSNKQTMQEQEQNRAVPQEPAVGAGTTGTMKDKGQNKKQQRVNKEDSSRDECSNNNNNGTTTTSPTTTFATEKPSVGSEEWHRLRRENHKQVERRRRETINEGINEIAKMIPGNEKNKGQILHRAAVHIRTLKEQQAEALEKWTLEKLLTDQAMNELSQQVDALKAEVDQTRKENEELKRRLVAVKEESSTSERATKRLKSQE